MIRLYSHVDCGGPGMYLNGTSRQKIHIYSKHISTHPVAHSTSVYHQGLDSDVVPRRHSSKFEAQSGRGAQSVDAVAERRLTKGGNRVVLAFACVKKVRR